MLKNSCLKETLNSGKAKGSLLNDCFFSFYWTKFWKTFVCTFRLTIVAMLIRFIRFIMISLLVFYLTNITTTVTWKYFTHAAYIYLYFSMFTLPSCFCIISQALLCNLLFFIIYWVLQWSLYYKIYQLSSDSYLQLLMFAYMATQNRY